MNKILYLGHYRERNTGWSNITKSHILALDSAGYDVVCRPVRLSEKDCELPQRILELEEKDDKDCDILIEHLLPHHMEWRSGFKKVVGIYYSETDNLPSEWSTKLGLLDELWVCNSQMVDAARKSGITKPVHIVPPPIDTSKFERTYPDFKSVKDKTCEDFTFLYVGEIHRRKNLSSIVKAFAAEFTTNEPVSLIIKPYKFNTSQQELENTVNKLCEEVKHGLKLYTNINDYKKEIIVSDYLSEEDLMSLHSTCDCLVSNSYAEALGLSIIDSMGLGKLVIANKVGWARKILKGYNEFDKSEPFWKDWANSLTITEHEQILEPVFGMNEGFPFLFTGKENWWQGSTTALMNRMRMAYEMSKEDKEIIGKEAINTLYEYSYKNFVQRIKELI